MVSFAVIEAWTNMAQVKLVLGDDEGNVSSGAENHLYSFGQDCQRLDELEQVVETWRRPALPQLIPG